jgi:hypothetical protein
MTDTNGPNASLWSIGILGNNRLFAGFTELDVSTEAHYFMAPIIAKGRVYVATHAGVYAFAP